MLEVVGGEQEIDDEVDDGRNQTDDWGSAIERENKKQEKDGAITVHN